MSARKAKAVESSRAEAATAAVTPGAAEAVTAKVDVPPTPRHQRVGTLMWKAGDARGWRSTFLSI